MKRCLDSWANAWEQMSFISLLQVGKKGYSYEALTGGGGKNL